MPKWGGSKESKIFLFDRNHALTSRKGHVVPDENLLREDLGPMGLAPITVHRPQNYHQGAVKNTTAWPASRPKKSTGGPHSTFSETS